MPLLDSGTALFAGSVSEFTRMAPASSLTAHLEKEFRSRFGRRVGESEANSWRRSLTALAEVFDDSILDGSGVGVELKLPWNSSRVDASFVARDEEGLPHVVLVELKQWETAAPAFAPEMVTIGPKPTLHPSVQAALYAESLREAHSAFTEDKFRLSACAYLHNMPSLASFSLRGTAFAGALREAPMFTADDKPAFADFLTKSLRGGGGMELLPRLIRGHYAPSKKFLDNLAQALTGSPVWTLLDEQREAFNIVRGLAERAASTGEKAVVIVTGGPGTGKSVIAANLVVALARGEHYSVAHATGSKAFTTNLRAVGGRGSPAVFRYFNNFAPATTPENSLDVLICDEAHRIRETSNDRFTPRARRSNIPQAQELMRAARVSVFLLDEHQAVRPGEIGTVAAIKAAAEQCGITTDEISLRSQFRCSGCTEYLDWVEALFSKGPQTAGQWRSTFAGGGEYGLEVVDSPRELERRVLERAEDGNTARLVAGYCWRWSDPNPDRTLVNDVEIGDWSRPWNEKSPEQQKPARSAPRPELHPYYQWAMQAKGVEEVGCVYSAQGFEFDYCGVIIGNDLVWRDGQGWVASRDASFDSAIRRRRHEPGALEALLSHTYRVLLTRGMKGTAIYSTDFDTRRMLQRLVNS